MKITSICGYMPQNIQNSNKGKGNAFFSKKSLNNDVFEKTNVTENKVSFGKGYERNFRFQEPGVEFPHGKRVLTRENAKLSLAKVFEIDLGADYIKKKFDEKGDDVPVTIGRNADISIPKVFPQVDEEHVTVEKTHNGYIVTDISKKGTFLQSPGVDYKQFVRNPEKDAFPGAMYFENAYTAFDYIEKSLDNGEYIRDEDRYESEMNYAQRRMFPYYNASHPMVLSRTEEDKNTEMVQEITEVASKYGDEYNTSPYKKTVRLKGIPSKIQPENVGNSHYYPHKGDEQPYIKMMYKTAKDMIKSAKKDAPEDKILEKAAEHFQYAVNAAPFEYGNSPFFSVETNALLKKAGLRAVPLGNLDFAAKRMQPENFKKYFKDYYDENKII